MKKNLLTAFLYLVTIFSLKAQNIFLQEDFSTSSGSTPPAGWTVQTAVGDPNVDVWRFDNPGRRTPADPVAGKFASFDSDKLSNNTLTMNSSREPKGTSIWRTRLSEPTRLPLQTVSKVQMTKFSIPADFLRTEDIDPFSNLKIYPNPTPGVFTVEMDNNNFGELSVDVFGQSGSNILNIKFEKSTEHFKSQVDLNGYAKGVY